MSVAALRSESLMMPWTDPVADERRFRRIVGVLLALTLLAALVVPHLKVSAPAPHLVEEVPQRFARIIEEQKPLPPPPPAPVVEEAAPAGPPEQAPAVAEPQPRPEPRAEPAPTPPSAIEVPVQPRAAARERAARSGLLALSNEIADIRSEGQTRALAAQDIQPIAPVAPPSATAPARDIITSQAGKGSGGIDAGVPAAAGSAGTQLAGRETTRVTAPAERAGGGGGAGGAGKARGPTLPPRSSEDIQRVFDQNRGALATIHTRALRTNPEAVGTVVFKLTILPSGQVADCSIVSSELGDKELERRLVARVRQFDFGARSDVSVTTITYPVDFFPG